MIEAHTVPCGDSSVCTGCGACVAICPLNCIRMQEDKYGASLPAIDKTKCSKCGICSKYCPANTPPTFSYPKACYASWLDNREERALCASGGLAYAISKYMIESRNGIVFGVAYNENMEPVFSSAETTTELEPFKGSKYVQARIDKSIYRQIIQYLKAGRFVLFVGTPCQVAGLYSAVKGVDTARLMTIDLICHGVAPARYLAEEVKTLTGRRRRAICDIRFRGNDDFRYSLGLIRRLLGRGVEGNNYSLTLWSRNKDGSIKRLYRGDKNHNYYLRGFLEGITLRDNCYSCRYARPERISDLTLGDFIGLGSNGPFQYSAGNVSSVFCNTDKGDKFYREAISSNSSLRNFERQYGERLNYRPSLLEPCPRHPLNTEFRRFYPELGYPKTIRRLLWRAMLMDRVGLSVRQYVGFPFRISKKVLRLLFRK